MGEILDQVTGREDVVPGPGLAVRVLREGRLAAGDELLVLRTSFSPLMAPTIEPRPLSVGDGPVSIVLIVAATSSI